MSQWGHDFRPDYKSLGMLKKSFPNVPIMALTATATGKVESKWPIFHFYPADVICNLNIRGCLKFTQSFNRANLRYLSIYRCICL